MADQGENGELPAGEIPAEAEDASTVQGQREEVLDRKSVV